MTNFKCSLPNNLFARLSDKAIELNLPKSEIIENALAIYFDQLSRAEYEKAFRNSANDNDILEIAEEGMEDFMKQLEF